MARIAIIDLGTNTFNILICDIENGQIKETLHKNKLPVKLGEGGINQGIIMPKPFERGIVAMEFYAQQCEDYKVDKVFAFATSAVRSASNGKEFCDKILANTGISINIIDGEREAELIYKGVQLSGILTKKKALILDIGGGSCEFIICDNTRIYWKYSFDLGVTRLFDRYKHQNPITKSEIAVFESLFQKELKRLFSALNKYPTRTLIGSSGSFDTFAEMICYRKFGNDIYSQQPKFELNVIDFFVNHHVLTFSTVEEREKMKGLVAMRIDMIVIASVMVNFLIRRLHIEELKVSAYSLKEGVLADLSEKH